MANNYVSDKMGPIYYYASCTNHDLRPALKLWVNNRRSDTKCLWSF